MFSQKVRWIGLILAYYLVSSCVILSDKIIGDDNFSDEDPHSLSSRYVISHDQSIFNIDGTSMKRFSSVVRIEPISYPLGVGFQQVGRGGQFFIQNFDLFLQNYEQENHTTDFNVERKIYFYAYRDEGVKVEYSFNLEIGTFITDDFLVPYKGSFDIDGYSQEYSYDRILSELPPNVRQVDNKFIDYSELSIGSEFKLFILAQKIDGTKNKGIIALTVKVRPIAVTHPEVFVFFEPSIPLDVPNHYNILDYEQWEFVGNVSKGMTIDRVTGEIFLIDPSIFVVNGGISRSFEHRVDLRAIDSKGLSKVISFKYITEMRVRNHAFISYEMIENYNLNTRFNEPNVVDIHIYHGLPQSFEVQDNAGNKILKYISNDYLPANRNNPVIVEVETGTRIRYYYAEITLNYRQANFAPIFRGETVDINTIFFEIGQTGIIFLDNLPEKIAYDGNNISVSEDEKENKTINSYIRQEFNDGSILIRRIDLPIRSHLFSALKYYDGEPKFVRPFFQTVGNILSYTLTDRSGQIRGNIDVVTGILSITQPAVINNNIFKEVVVHLEKAGGVIEAHFGILDLNKREINVDIPIRQGVLEDILPYLPINFVPTDCQWLDPQPNMIIDMNCQVEYTGIVTRPTDIPFRLRIFNNAVSYVYHGNMLVSP